MDEERQSEQAQSNAPERITKDMLLGEVVAKHPKVAFVFLQYGLHCIGCHISAFETIEQGCLGHGMPPHVMEEMIEDANMFLAEDAEEAASGPGSQAPEAKASPASEPPAKPLEQSEAKAKWWPF